MKSSKIIITLLGAYEGLTKKLNSFQFVDGVFTAVGTPDEVAGLRKYFENSYNCEVWVGDPNEGPDKAKAEPVVEEEIEVEEIEITERQEAILEAIGAIDRDTWVEDVVNHPSVADVVTLTGDPTVTKEEIVEVIECWYEEIEAPTEE
jgi:hypothetical protein